jgi:hypothetical protein
MEIGRKSEEGERNVGEIKEDMKEERIVDEELFWGNGWGERGNLKSHTAP